MRTLTVAATVIAFALLSASTAPAATCTDGFKPVQVRHADGRWRPSGAISVTLVPGGPEAWAIGGPTGMLHYTGTRWETVPMPQPPPDERFVRLAVHARSATDVVAVGQRLHDGPPAPSRQPLVERWNGNQWVEAEAPSVPVVDSDGDGGRFQAVVSAAADDAWAVGSHRSDGLSGALAAHWDGSGWAVMPDAGLSAWNALGPVEDQFTAVDRVPHSGTRWFVGSWSDEAGYGALIHRYNGSWGPAMTLPGATLLDVTARAWDDVWAVGSGGPGGSALTVHKTATGWSTVPSPALPAGEAVLRSVASVSPRNAWAVGSIGGQPLVEHWDGTGWSVASSPAEGVLYDVALRPSGWGWVAGSDTLLQACGV